MATCSARRCSSACCSAPFRSHPAPSTPEAQPSREVRESQLTREARQPGWWHSFRDVLPNPYEVYIGLEAGAASIRNFEPIVVPGLLQTEDYARATFRNGPRELDADEVQRRVEVRLARQEILARDDRPRLWAVIDEAVIHRAVGGVHITQRFRPLFVFAQLLSLEHCANLVQHFTGTNGTNDGTATRQNMGQPRCTRITLTDCIGGY